MAHSPHRRFKGHCLLCATGRKVRGLGKVARMPFRDQRRIGSKRRTPPDRRGMVIAQYAPV